MIFDINLFAGITTGETLLLMKLSIPLVCLLFFVYPLCAQVPDGEKVLSKAGNREITLEEFTKRYEGTPFPGKQKKGKEKENQLEFLYTLIAEKLWSTEAEVQHLDTMEAIRFSEEAYRKMFVRDALFRNAIRKKVDYTDADLKTAIKRNRLKLKIGFLFSADKSEINNLYSLLQKGMPFDTLLSGREEFEEQKERMEVAYGDLSPLIEDEVYSLKENKYTKPLEAVEGWYIFYLYSSTYQSEMTLEDNLKAAEKVVKQRVETKLYNEYRLAFFKDKQFTIQTPLLKSLAEKMARTFSMMKKTFALDDTVQFRLYSQFAVNVIDSYPETELQSSVADFTGGSLTLRNLILQFAFDLTPFDGTTPDTLYHQIVSKIRYLSEMEMLANEGIRQGYDKLPEVIKETKERKENYLFQALQNKFVDSVKVDEKEIKEIYAKQYTETTYPTQVNIIEVLCSDAATAELVLKEARQGADMRVLAKKYNKRASTQKTDGEFGFFPVILYGELGRIAGTLETGDIYGPLVLNEGFSVFKVIGKKAGYTEKPSKTYEQVKAEIKNKLLAQRLEGVMNTYTAQLGIKYGIKINREVFNKIDVTNINSVLMRKLGFGGTISASPMIAPNTGWVEIYNNLKLSLP